MDYAELINKMKEKGVLFSEGLTQSEFEEIERQYQFEFPPDLRDFLSIALPTSDKFINWRDMSTLNVELVQKRLDCCLEGILFDIEHNNFWLKEWGRKPDELLKATNKCIDEI